MSTTGSDESPIRLLIVAPYPFGSEEATGADADQVETVLIRRPQDLEFAVGEATPDVIVVSTAFPERKGVDAIGEVRAIAPGAAVLALTPDPPSHEDVALATRAGARGFVVAGTVPAEFLEAVLTVNRGGNWFPPEETKSVFTAVAGDLDTTAQERRSRLLSIVIGLVPVTGAIAAVLALLYRRYLGQIGVRPVDIAIDPASRVVDAVSVFFLLLGFFGPFLFVGSWLDILRESPLNRGPLARLLAKPRLSHFALSLLVLVAVTLLALGINVGLIVFVGPLVGFSLVARALDLSEELPLALRLERIGQQRALFGGGMVSVLFLASLSFEAFVVGPRFDSQGVDGFLLPRTVGFNATPMRVLDVESGGESELLYLGGNADLYVLVDPCDDDEVLYVSVGATRLVVTDEVTC